MPWVGISFLPNFWPLLGLITMCPHCIRWGLLQAHRSDCKGWGGSESKGYWCYEGVFQHTRIWCWSGCSEGLVQIWFDNSSSSIIRWFGGFQGIEKIPMGEAIQLVAVLTECWPLVAAAGWRAISFNYADGTSRILEQISCDGWSTCSLPIGTGR